MTLFITPDPRLIGHTQAWKKGHTQAWKSLVYVEKTISLSILQ